MACSALVTLKYGIQKSCTTIPVYSVRNPIFDRYWRKTEGIPSEVWDLWDNCLEETKNGIFEIVTDHEKQTVFVREVVDQWYVVIAVSNRELFAEVWQQLTINVLICAAIFAMIAFVFLIGRRNERSYSHRIEEMRAEEQKQAYEARALKLEKEAADRANQAKSRFLAWNERDDPARELSRRYR